MTLVQLAVQWLQWFSRGSQPRHRKNLKHLIIIGSLLAVPAETEGWERAMGTKGWERAMETQG